MKKLYEAASPLEAQMLVDVLRQQNVHAAIEGQYLPGAIGELPANGLVRVVVAEEDEEAARQIVADWKNSKLALESDSDAVGELDVAEASTNHTANSGVNNSNKGKRFGFLSGLLFGGTMVGVLLLLYFRVPSITDVRDRNHDGKQDEFTSYAQSGIPLRNEVDRNFDGKIDEMTVFEKDGLAAQVETDDNFDGVFENQCFYSNGIVERCETDTDGDGFADMKTHLKNGVVTSVEHVERNSGLPFRVDYYKLGKMTESELDTDKDGKLDTRITYDTRLEIVKREAIQP